MSQSLALSGSSRFFPGQDSTYQKIHLKYNIKVNSSDWHWVEYDDIVPDSAESRLSLLFTEENTVQGTFGKTPK